jgi:ubiquinone/menaquinone biosynthesis C-methylase UbiE
MAIFDEFATSYDAWYTEKMGMFVDKVETELAFHMIKMEEGMKILDVGCGTGNFSVKLAKMGCRVTGIDVSDEMLSIARNKAKDQNLNIDFQKMDVYDLKFDDNEYDAVISMAAFEFILEPKKALAELFRVVKLNGQVLVGTISGDSAWGELYQSEQVRNSTVFKYADFKTLEDMKGWKPEYLIRTGECLFVPPLADESEFHLEREKELCGTRKGGYICALWKK